MTRIEIIYRKLKREFAFTSELIVPKRIAIGNHTKLLRGAFINASAGTISIGSKCYVDRNVIISCNGGDIIIGDHCSFNPYCVIYGHGGLRIGNDVRIAAGTIIIPANHGFNDKNRKICEQPISAKGITIGNDCWIGAGVNILDGVTIGDGCVIGAGSVVTKTVEPFTVVVGNPAKVIRNR
ncbi:MAG: acyltransferase [Maribacter sp.]|nr:acyltransferase [Candidatus Brocadiaceae bacterium]MCP4978484.1 acyltransferase [Maribacter sp.]